MKYKKIKFDDCYLTDEESRKFNRLNESLNYDDNLSEDIGISVENAREILIARLKKIVARHER